MVLVYYSNGGDMKELTQKDLVVLSLAEHRGWRRAYELERQVVGKEMIGSEADTRLYEIFDKNVPNLGEKEVVINGDTYTVETKKDGGARWWRAYLKSKKPRSEFVLVIFPDGRRGVREIIV